MTGTITILDKATPELRRIAAQLARPEALHADLGRGLRRDLQDHFQSRQSSGRNKRGWPRQNFWRDVKTSVQAPVSDAGGASVAITHEAIGAKVFGARIVARNARALTIPVHELAYGRTASGFEQTTGHDLFRILSKKGNALLMADLGRGAVPIYALKKAVNVPRDPRALPPESKLTESIVLRARKHLARVLGSSRQA